MIGRMPAPSGIHPLSHTLAPILVLGVFVFDTFFVAFSRGKRKSISGGAEKIIRPTDL